MLGAIWRSGYRILRSRFLNISDDKEFERKKSICLKCEFNSKNTEKIILYKKILIRLSDFYSWITGNSDKDNLGNCLGCKSCSVYYKLADNDKCPKNYWEIEDKTVHLNIRKLRKDESRKST